MNLYLFMLFLIKSHHFSEVWWETTILLFSPFPKIQLSVKNLICFPREEEEDRALWVPSASGEYSSRTAWNAIISEKPKSEFVPPGVVQPPGAYMVFHFMDGLLGQISN